MIRQSPAKLAAILILAWSIWMAGTGGPLTGFVQNVKQKGASAALATGKPQKAALREWIEAEGAKRRIAPIDAVVDRVWKAIPGYNGREVDVEATYEKAIAIGATASEPFPWVYREIEPRVSLGDLPVEPIYRGNPSKPSVGLMINVAWGDEYLPAILKTLQDEGVKATFFFDGTWLSKHLDTAEAIQAAGHELSNHAYTHPKMSLLSAGRQREEISKTEQLLDKLGVKNVWFAPPSGDYNRTTVVAAAEQGLRTVLWTLDTVDWTNPSPSSVVAKIAKNVSAGSLILMHPTAATRASLPGIIKAIRAKGLQPGTVSVTLSEARLP